MFRLDELGNSIGVGSLNLHRCFFNPACWQEEGVDVLYRGMARQRHRTVGLTHTDGVFQILF